MQAWSAVIVDFGDIPSRPAPRRGVMTRANLSVAVDPSPAWTWVTTDSVFDVVANNRGRLFSPNTFICDTAGSVHVLAAQTDFWYDITRVDAYLGVGGGTVIPVSYLCSVSYEVIGNGNTLTLTGMRFADGFGPNILSIGRLAASGIVFIVADTIEAFLPDRKTLLFTAKMRSDMPLWEVALRPRPPPPGANVYVPPGLRSVSALPLAAGVEPEVPENSVHVNFREDDDVRSPENSTSFPLQRRLRPPIPRRRALRPPLASSTTSPRSPVCSFGTGGRTDPTSDVVSNVFLTRLQRERLVAEHQRWGHRNFRDIAAFLGLPAPNPPPFCSVCALSKMARRPSARYGPSPWVPAPRSAFRLYMDVIGPFRVRTMHGESLQFSPYGLLLQTSFRVFDVQGGGVVSRGHLPYPQN